MIAKVEAVQSWLENITYQMTTMNYSEQSKHLAGPIALLKVRFFLSPFLLFCDLRRWLDGSS
jgi:hypothetical protein